MVSKKRDDHQIRKENVKVQKKKPSRKMAFSVTPTGFKPVTFRTGI
jgi:hypothetical protein